MPYEVLIDPIGQAFEIHDEHVVVALERLDDPRVRLRVERRVIDFIVGFADSS